MRKFLLLSFILLSLATQQGHAQEMDLGDASYLYKLSQALKGVAPTSEELKSLQQARVQNRMQEFFKGKIQEYLQSQQYAEKMSLRLEDLFFLRPSEERKLLYKFKNDSSTYETSAPRDASSTLNLFRELAAKNLPLDQLLTGKSYKLSQFADRVPDKNFFANLLKIPHLEIPGFFDDYVQNPTEVTGYESIQFAQDDARIAGVITSPRFFSRYTTTALNKNRRRAAAIFRVFLCDPMTAAIPQKHDNSKLKDVIFPDNELSEDKIREAMADKHGELAACMNCHRKLDPAGMTLRGSPVVPATHPSPGALVFTGKGGRNVQIPVRGVGELGKAITQQPEYEQCQVRYFWNWFIGKDVELSAAKQQELVTEFNRVGRRTNDFVSYIVQRPEFKVRRSVDQRRQKIIEVRHLLQRCDACHAGKDSDDYGPLPMFNEWPIGKQGTEYDAKFWLQRIWMKLALEHDGKGRTMPPGDDGFRPTQQEILNIKTWIQMGAPDESGKKMVTP